MIDPTLLFAKAKYYQSKGLRYGQSLYNALAEIDYNLTLKIVNTEYDPFNNDCNIEKFLNYILYGDNKHE